MAALSIPTSEEPAGELIWTIIQCTWPAGESRPTKDDVKRMREMARHMAERMKEHLGEGAVPIIKYDIVALQRMDVAIVQGIRPITDGARYSDYWPHPLNIMEWERGSAETETTD